MNTISIEPKRVIAGIIINLYGIKSKEIETTLHISQALVSKHFNGERNCPEIDIYIIEKVFGIRVIKYNVEKQY